MPGPGPIFDRRDAMRVTLLAVPVAIGVAVAWRGAWLCDDVFVSFRYIDHQLRGYGLVFNPGERVEGYTHFLWVILLAALHGCGLDLLSLGRYLPVAAWAGTLAILFVHGVRGGARGSHRPWLALPIAAWGLALHRDAQIYASSGLETAFFGLLLLLGLVLVAGARPRLELAAVVYSLATLVRPEGALYTATAALWILVRWRAWRRVAKPAAIWAGLVVPFVIWKTVYYGTPIPNTYYAKSAALPYWTQGWTYARLYFSIYAVLLVCLAVAVVVLAATARRRDGTERATALDAPATDPGAWRGLALLAVLQVLCTIAYVMRVGGDFMFARFFLPATPLAYLAAEEAVRRGLGRPAWTVLLAAVVVGGTLAARIPRARTFVGTQRVHGVVDEPNEYSPAVFRDLRHQGEVLHQLAAASGARIALPPGRTMVAYFGRLPYAVEGSGLTDAEIARTPVAERGRPGHEKGPSDEYLRRHRVPLVLLWGAHRAARLPAYERLRAGDVFLRIVYWDEAVLDALRALPGVEFVDFPAALDRYLDTAGRAPSERLLEDAAAFQRFYFDHNSDPVRRARLQAALRAAEAGRSGPGATPPGSAGR